MRTIAETNFDCLPSGTLVEGIVVAPCAGRVPFLIEPIEVRIVIRNPLLDGLTRWLDGLHGGDIEGWRWRARKLNDAFPETLEAEEELDFFAAEESANWFHGPRAAGTLEGITTPNLENEVAPEGAHVAGSAFGRRGDEEDLGGWRLFLRIQAG